MVLKSSNGAVWDTPESFLHPERFNTDYNKFSQINPGAMNNVYNPDAIPQNEQELQ